MVVPHLVGKAVWTTQVLKERQKVEPLLLFSSWEGNEREAHSSESSDNMRPNGSSDNKRPNGSSDNTEEQTLEKRITMIVDDSHLLVFKGHHYPGRKTH